jgi:uncharacterized protein (DUF2267 family)
MKEREFLSEVQAGAGLRNREAARRWALAVTGAVADLAPDSETRRRFITQLPRFLKSALQARAPRALLMDRDALIQHVGAALDIHARDAQQAMLVVWTVTRKAVSAGEIADFEARMPRDVAALLRTAA